MKKHFIICLIAITLLFTSTMTSAQAYDRELKFSDEIKEGQEFEWSVDEFVWNFPTITDNGLDQVNDSTTTIYSTSTEYPTTTDATTTYVTSETTYYSTETVDYTEYYEPDIPFEEGSIFGLEVIQTPTDFKLGYFVEEDDGYYYNDYDEFNFDTYFKSRLDGSVVENNEIFPIDLFIEPTKLRVGGVDHNVFEYAMDTGEFVQNQGFSEQGIMTLENGVFTITENMTDDYTSGIFEMQFHYESGVLIRYYQEIQESDDFAILLDINLLTDGGLDVRKILEEDETFNLPLNSVFIYSAILMLTIFYRKRR